MVRASMVFTGALVTLAVASGSVTADDLWDTPTNTAADALTDAPMDAEINSSNASLFDAKIQECSSLGVTVVSRDAHVKLPNNLYGRHIVTFPNNAAYAVPEFTIVKPSRADITVNLKLDNIFASVVPKAKPWCEKKGKHHFDIQMRGICRASHLDEGNFVYYKMQIEHQMGIECQGQHLGTCRILRVSKNAWIESQDEPASGGSMVDIGNGKLLLKWETCPDHVKQDTVIAYPAAHVLV